MTVDNSSQLVNGNIYQIELMNNYGYGYVQVVLTGELGLDNHVLLRIFDYHSLTPFDKETDYFDSIDELVAPSIMLTLPKTTGKNKWNLVGRADIPEGYTVPQFKSDPTTKSWKREDWNNISWYIITNLIANGLDGGYNYKQVKHLPFWRHCTSLVFKAKLTMYWLKKTGREIGDYINLDEQYNYKVMYNEVQNAVFYSEINPHERNTHL